MKAKLMRRTLLMVGLAVAMVGASALPASAVDTPLTFTTDVPSGNPGTLIVNGTTINVPGTGAGACDTGAASSVSPDINSGTGDVQMLVTDWHLATGTIRISGVDYQVQITGNASTGGIISGSSATISIDVDVTLKTCDGSSTVCIVNSVDGTLTGTFTDVAPTGLPMSAGDRIDDLAGTSNQIIAADFNFGCNVNIRAFFLNQTVAINVHLVR